MNLAVSAAVRAHEENWLPILVLSVQEVFEIMVGCHAKPAPKPFSSGNLVIQAERSINMNNEKQTILLRGVVRRGDVGPGNTVVSNVIGDLELEIKGKGVVSNGVRPPNILLRLLLRIFNF